MGTNYYANLNVCGECGRHDGLHIGKSSSGWRFCWCAHPDKNLRTRKDWEQLLRGKGVNIKDEYGKDVPVEDFLAWVTARDAEPFNHRTHEKDYLDTEGHRFYDGVFS